MRRALVRLVVMLVAFLAFVGAVVEAQTQGATATGATHTETSVIGRTPETQFAALGTLRLDSEGRLLVCDTGRKHIRVISPAGKVLATWKLPMAPVALWRCDDGTMYVADAGKVAKLDKSGKVLKTVDLPGADAAAAQPRRRGGRSRAAKPSGITASKKDVFVAVGTSWSLRSRSSVIRFNRDLGEPKVIATDLRGCCQRLDMVARDDVLYVAENARYRVVRYDREGKVLSTWGRRDRNDVSGFGSCCNPMNLCFGPGGVLYTAESGLGRVKRYTLDGKFLSLVGYVGVARFARAGRLAASCSNIAIAVTKDGSRVYVQDVKNNIIRVLERKGQPAGEKGTTDTKDKEQEE